MVFIMNTCETIFVNNLKEIQSELSDLCNTLDWSVDNNRLGDKLFTVSSLKRFLIENGIYESVYLGLIRKSSLSESPIHVDLGHDGSKYVITIPISGCKNTYFKMWNTTQEIKQIENDGHSLDESQCTLVYTVESVNPIIFFGRTPHNVSNRNDKEDRYVLLMRMKKDFDYDKFMLINTIIDETNGDKNG